MAGDHKIIDVWMQHPNMEFINHPMFDSLRKWTGQEKLSSEIPVDLTTAAMDQARVSLGLICAWWGPCGPLIHNDEVAAHVKDTRTDLLELLPLTCTGPWTASAS